MKKPVGCENWKNRNRRRWRRRRRGKWLPVLSNRPQLRSAKRHCLTALSHLRSCVQRCVDTSFVKSPVTRRGCGLGEVIKLFCLIAWSFFDNSEKRQSQANTETQQRWRSWRRWRWWLTAKAAVMLPVPPCWLQILCTISSYRHCVNEIFAHVGW